QLKIDQPKALINNYSLSSPLYKHALNDCSGAIAGSPFHHNYCLLICQSKACFSLIFIEDNQRLNKTPIDYFVSDISWFQSKQVFLVSTEYHLYEFSPLSNHLSKPYENFKSTRTLCSLACNSTNLYIINKPNMIIYERYLKKPFKKKREWTKNDLMYDKDDQTIGCIRMDEQRQILALSIKQIDIQCRVDLFSIDNMEHLHSGPSFKISHQMDSCYCMITPLLNSSNQWLVEKCQTILLDENAQVINQIDRYNGYNATLTGRDKIVFLD
ncbi:unnamed protein product, partial [Rotaria sp. Silwood2]